MRPLLADAGSSAGEAPGAKSLFVDQFDGGVMRRIFRQIDKIMLFHGNAKPDATRCDEACTRKGTQAAVKFIAVVAAVSSVVILSRVGGAIAGKFSSAKPQNAAFIVLALAL